MKKFLSICVLAVLVLSCRKFEPVLFHKGLTLSLNEWQVDARGDVLLLTVTSEQPWTLACDEEWIVPDRVSGPSTAKMLLRVGANVPEQGPREAELVFSSGEFQRTLTVTQEALVPYLRVDRKQLNIPNTKANAEYKVHVQSNTSWSVTAPEGVLVSPLSGNADAELTVRTEAVTISVPLQKNTLIISGEGTENVSVDIYRTCSYSNTFYVDEEGDFAVQALRGDGSAVVGIASAELLGETSGELLSAVSFGDGLVSFHASGAEGYAVVGARASGGELLWTWLIVRGEMPSDVRVGEELWMDRNVGAWETGEGASVLRESAVGAMYVSGTALPLPGARTAALSPDPGKRETVPWGDATLQLGYDPSALSVAAGHWSAGEKGAWDPCPAGYRLPAQSDWIQLETGIGLWTRTVPMRNSLTAVYENAGSRFFIPASGYILEGIHYDSGAQALYSLSDRAEDAVARPVRCIKMKAE